MAKYLSKQGLARYHSKINDMFGSFARYFTENLEALAQSKVNKISGKGLSTNDFTNTYKSKVDSIPKVIKASSEVQAKQLSKQNPNNIYYW